MIKRVLSVALFVAVAGTACGGPPAPAEKDLCELLTKADFPWPGELKPGSPRRETDSVRVSCAWSAGEYSVDLDRMIGMPMEAVKKTWNFKDAPRTLGGREVFVHRSGYTLDSEERTIECQAAMLDGSDVVKLRVRYDDATDLCADVSKLAGKVAEALPR